MMNEVKLCIDCRYYPKISLIDRLLGMSKLARCRHPKAIDRVSGKPKMFCGVMRDVSNASGYLGICGTEGAWFESKEVA